ncbi:MAG TPA: FAD-dependent oxidoreductase, partial [Thermomicrobiales bacterium]|nr:FAD-dependent oxidoreductase [Thermomicrobiales bacterium]
TARFPLPTHAQVVIVGAGIVGVCAAWELTRRGITDIVVLDRGDLFQTGGSTSHAPGGIFQNNGSRTVSKLAQYSVQTFLGANADGPDPVYYPTGGLEVATTPARWQDLHRKYGYARSWGLDASLVSPAETGALLPLLDQSTILGAIHIVGDGCLKAVPFVERIAARASAGGARFFGRTKVTGFEISDLQMRSVQTDQGTIQAEQVLLCGGIWGPLLGQMAGVPVPLQPCAHPYVRTTPLTGLAGKTAPTEPLWRHQDHSMYFMQWDDRYVVGSYRHEPVIVDPEAIDDSRPAPADLDWDESVFTSAWKEAGRMVPSIRIADRSETLYGMFSFTPDTHSLVGEVSGVVGLYLAEAVWVTHGPGVAAAVADLMTSGATDLDLRELDANRFGPHATSRSYVRTRGAQNYREVYDIIHPRDVVTAPRGLRRTPFYDHHELLGAVWTESDGWERPLWFEANDALPVPIDANRHTDWDRKHWSPIAGAEHIATRANVGLFDMSTFTKIHVYGPGALAAMEKLTPSRVAKPVGSVTYAVLLNQRGGVESDLTIIREGENHFVLMCGSGSGQRDLAWVRRHLLDERQVQVEELTSARTALGLWGPNAQAILQPITSLDLDPATFPRFTSKHAHIAGAPVTIIRISYVGEEGYELHVPTEYGMHLWEAIWAAGEPHGMVAAGLTAMDSLRLEKGYLSLGTDLRSEYTPCEAGIGFTVSKNRSNYIGAEALASRPLTHTLATLTVDDGTTVVMGKEPILQGDQVVGYVASANFGYTIGQSIVLAYLPSNLAQPGTRLTVEYFGTRHPITFQQAPLLA